jgi:lysophospholipase L1-like esterase
MSWLRIVTINLIVFAVIFGVLEIVTRATLPEYVDAYFDDDTTWGKPIYRNHALNHRVNPDQRDSSLKRTGDEKRVLFIGDSVTFGYGVDFADTYHEIAAHLLGDGGCDVTIHGVGQYYTNLEKLTRSNLWSFILEGFGANIVVYQFNVNDLDIAPPPKKSADDPLTWRERFEKFRLSYLNRSALLKFIQSRSMRAYQQSHPTKLQDSLRYSPLSDPGVYAAAWESFEKTLVDVNDMLRRRGTRFSILLVPESFQISRSAVDNDVNADVSGITQWPNERVADLGMRYNIPVFDSLQALREFRARHPDKRLYFPNDQNHPNREGHAVIGVAVAAYLKETLGGCSRVSTTTRLE